MLNLLLPHPAALVKTKKTKILLIADPHIGWENKLQKKGIHVPSQTPKLLSKLVSIIGEYKPDKLIILGDVKYSVVSSEISEWQDIPDFFKKIHEHVNEIAVVRGNHDANLEPLLPDYVEFLTANGINIGDVGMFHGHKWPTPTILSCKTLVMGHLHPVVILRDPSGCKITKQVWIKIRLSTEAFARTLLEKWNIKTEETIEKTIKKHYNVELRARELFVMPSFNDFLGGRSINETHHRKEIDDQELIGPVLRSKAINVDEAELYLLDGSYLGTLSQLKKLT